MSKPTTTNFTPPQQTTTTSTLSSSEYEQQCDVLFALTNEMRQMEERLLQLNVKSVLNSMDVMCMYDPQTLQQFTDNVETCNECVARIESRIVDEAAVAES